MLSHWLIEKKRDGFALTRQEIEFVVSSFVSGSMPDYQMTAFAMAVYFQGMSREETAWLTDAMMRSGDLVDTSAIQAVKVDKHSTGGVGDKVSLVLAPLVACAGIAVPMISGRGLGITGGTLDKLESIPGFRTDLDAHELVDVVQRCGCVITGQTGQLAPADKKLYALRDVTGTVPSIPLIVSSIMCKKLAEGIDALVLDVKFGRGAFMKTREKAAELGRAMVEVGNAHGKAVSALLTDMNQPLGCAVGNALEVIEAIDIMAGRMRGDILDVTLALAVRMLQLARPDLAAGDAQRELESYISNGAALRKFEEMVRLQGGDVGLLLDRYKSQPAGIVEPIVTQARGYVASIDPDRVGRACILLGAGRATARDDIDHAVGLSQLVKEGQAVEPGAMLARVHANDRDRYARAIELLKEAFEIVDSPPPARPLIAEVF